MASFLDGHGGYCTCTRDKCTYDCATYRRFKPKPITNSMRIRTMTDEELAGFLIQDGDCPPERMYPDSCPNCDRVTPKVCYDCWLDWLKQEATE